MFFSTRFVRLFCLIVCLAPSLDGLMRPQRVRLQPQAQPQVQPQVQPPQAKVREVCEENDLTFLRKLEIEAGLALEASYDDHASFQRLGRLNKNYLNQLLRTLGTCKVRMRVDTDSQMLQKICETLVQLYRYELCFPEIKRSIYPFRSTISHLSCLIMQKAPIQILEEKVEEFSSVYVALKLAFETVQEELDYFLNDAFIYSFKNALLRIAKQDGFSRGTRNPISLQGHEAVLEHKVDHGPGLEQPQPQQRSLSRRVLGGTAKLLLATLGLLGVGWLSKRYIVDPIRRYRNLADMAEKFLERVKDLPLNQIIQEAVKATAELPEEKQKQFLDLVFAAMRPETVDDKKELLKIMIERVGALPQNQQEQMFKTIAQVFNFDCDDAVFEGMNVGQIKNDMQRFMVWYGRYKQAEEIKNNVVGRGRNLLGRGRDLLGRGRRWVGDVYNRARNFVRRDQEEKKEEEKEEDEKKEDEKKGVPLREIIKEMNEQQENEQQESNDSDDDSESDDEDTDYEEIDDEGYETAQEELDEDNKKEDDKKEDDKKEDDKKEDGEKEDDKVEEEQDKEEQASWLWRWIGAPANDYVINPMKKFIWG